MFDMNPGIRLLVALVTSVAVFIVANEAAFFGGAFLMHLVPLGGGPFGNFFLRFLFLVMIAPWVGAGAAACTSALIVEDNPYFFACLFCGLSFLGRMLLTGNRDFAGTPVSIGGLIVGFPLVLLGAWIGVLIRERRARQQRSLPT